MIYTSRRIKEIRRKLQWSQATLANFAECSRNSVAMVEKGLDAPVKQKIVAALERGLVEATVPTSTAALLHTISAGTP